MSTRRYDVTRSLGGGEFGEVFAARDREHGGTVALKVLRRRDGEWLYRFKREFRQVADVAHPNLVRLFELFEEDGDWYLTMELVDGLAFDDHLARAPEQLESCFSQLAGAIAALHKTGALHRDIKPMNALVEASGRVVLLDFGLAYGVATPDATVVAGTPHYMAPEQWLNELSEATDWYAFGLMLYEALADRPAFAATGMELLEAKRRGPSPLAANAGDPRLQQLAFDLLAPIAADRPKADEVLAVFRAGASPDTWTGDDLPFVGRDAELARVCSAAARAPAVIGVFGDAGIGKTALVRAFVQRARIDGAAVYEGRCHETESAPYKGIDGAIDMLCNDLRRRSARELAALLPNREYHLPEMFPVLKRVGFLSRTHGDDALDPHARRAAAVAELRDLLSKIAAERQVIVFIDDLQWAGQDTLTLLLELLASASLPIVLVATARADADTARQFCARAAAATAVPVTSIELTPLDRGDVSALFAEHRTTFDSEAAWRESGGHPYLLSRMLAGGASGGLTSSLESSIAALSADARALIDVVALAGRPLPQAAAFTAAGLGNWRADVVDELRRQRLVQTRGLDASADITAYHDRVREAVLATLDAATLRSRHGALAQYLEQHRRAAPHALAHHYQAAGSHDDALRWAVRAARDAVRGLAFAQADELYGQAVALSPAGEVELRTEWAAAMALAGRRARAAALYFDAATAADLGSSATAAAELRTRSGEESILAGHFQRGIELIELALADAGVPLPTDSATAAALAMNVGAALSVRGLDFSERSAAHLEPAALRRLDLLLTTARALALTDLRCGYIAALALRDALDLGEPGRVQEALCHFVIGAAATAPDHPIFADAVRRAYALAERSDSARARTWAITAEAALRMQAGDVGDAWPLLEAGEQRFGRLDPPMLREAGAVRILRIACGAIGGVNPTFSLGAAGDWLAEAEGREDLFVANWLRLVGARIKLLAGDYDGAVAQAAEARAIWSHLDDNIFVSSYIHAEMFSCVYATPATAYRRGRELEVALRRMFVSAAPVGSNDFYMAYGAAVTAAGAAGSITSAETVASIEHIIEQLSLHRYNAPAIPCLRAHLAVQGGDRGAASALMSASVTGWDQQQQILHAACTRLRHAQLCRAQDRAASVHAELRAMGVGDPDRYATVLAGPAPPP